MLRCAQFLFEVTALISHAIFAPEYRATESLMVATFKLFAFLSGKRECYLSVSRLPYSSVSFYFLYNDTLCNSVRVRFCVHC